MPRIYLSVMTYNPKGIQVNFHSYEKIVDGVNRQKGVDIDLCFIDNSNNEDVRNTIIGFGKRAMFIKQRIHVNAAWNLGIRNMTKGEYDWYGFNASDVISNDERDFETLLKDANIIGNCHAISGQSTCDMSNAWPELLGHADIDPTRVELGRGINGHLTLFSRKFVETYNGRVDVLYSGRTEPFIPYQCAAIGGHEAISHRVLFNHTRERALEREDSLDDDRPVYGTWDEFSKLLDKGVEFGLGWEECYTVNQWKYMKAHDVNKFNADKLRDFIKDNLYLKPSFFENLEYEIYDPSCQT